MGLFIKNNHSKKMKTKIRIRKWYVFLEYGASAKHWIIDLSNEDVNDDEITWCIQKQIYGEKK